MNILFICFNFFTKEQEIAKNTMEDILDSLKMELIELKTTGKESFTC